MRALPVTQQLFSLCLAAVITLGVVGGLDQIAHAEAASGEPTLSQPMGAGWAAAERSSPSAAPLPCPAA